MKLYGVFIGIDKYRDPMIRNLNFAKADAERFYDLFQQKIDPASRTLWLLTDEDATRSQIIKTVGEDVSRLAEEEDIVIIQFSGHGSPETSGSVDQVSGYLIAHDTEYQSIFATGVDMERELIRWFHRIRSRVVFFFLDSCFSGRAGGRTFEGSNIHHLGYRGTIQLDKLDLGKGRLIMSACDDDQVALEKSELGHGVFTYHLLETLTDPDYSDETISIDQLYNRTFRKVKMYTMGRQTPVINGRIRGAQIPILRY